MSARRAALAVLALVVLSGCRPHPESESGADAWRDQPEDAEVGVWLADDIDPGIDRTDWKRFVLDAPDHVRVRAVVPEPSTEIILGLYDVYGVLIEERRKEPGAGLAAQLELRQHLDTGTYYLRVRGLRGAPTNYSVRIDAGPLASEEVAPGGEERIPE